jgi:hypothetical protein
MGYCFKLVGDAPVQAKELLIDEAGKGDIIEHLHRQVVSLLVVLAQA